MPLTRQVFDTSEEPCNISAMLHQVLELVKGIDAKVDALRTNHEVLKKRVAVVGQSHTRSAATKKLSTQTLTGAKRARTDNYTPDAAETDAPVPPTAQAREIGAPDMVQMQDAGRCLTPQCAAHHKPEIKKLVQEYITHKNWATLIKGLRAVLNPQSLAYKQLGSAVSLNAAGYFRLVQLISVLLCAGLPLGLVDQYGGSLLSGLVLIADVNLIERLLKDSDTVDIRLNKGMTPLMLAAQLGRLEVVQWLVQARADTAAKDDTGNTALNLATSNGCTEVVQYLSQYNV